jgi:hypothetical protein
MTPTRDIPIIIRRTAGTPNYELYELHKNGIYCNGFTN